MDRHQPPLVVAEEVTKTVRSGRATARIIDGVSFTVPARSLFAINGPSGSGKTTLLNLLAGIDRPSQGRVLVQGQSLMGESENALARWRAQNVGIVFQSFHLIPTLTASENVLLALELGRRHPRSSWRERTAACLAAVGMGSYARRLPSELSGGEQQRIAIARALANDPPLIVADEPTGNLDSKNAATVFSLLERLTEADKTVIFVTHDRQLASRASASVDLLDGRIVACRNPSTLEDRSCVALGR
jgi:putative ABC transport system ATP-binding protein